MRRARDRPPTGVTTARWPRTLPEVVAHWSDAEVAYRWIMVRPPVKVRKRPGFPAGAPPQPEEVLRLLANPFEVALRAQRSVGASAMQSPTCGRMTVVERICPSTK